MLRLYSPITLFFLGNQKTWKGSPLSIPIKYAQLNPYDILSTRALTFAYGRYMKVLSEFEIEALMFPQTEHDKEILAGLPP